MSQWYNSESQIDLRRRVELIGGTRCRMLRSSEADGSADDALDGLSAVSLSVSSAAAEMHLHEREVVDGHRAVRRVDGQFREHAVAPRKFSGVGVLGRLQLTVVGEQSQLRVGIPVAVLKRDVCTVHLNIRDTSFSLLFHWHDTKYVYIAEVMT